MSELGGLIFGDRKASDEPGYVNVLNLEGDDEKMQIVVKSIFKKAQTQHAYIDLCSQIVCLELKIKGFEPIIQQVKEENKSLTVRVCFLGYRDV